MERGWRSAGGQQARAGSTLDGWQRLLRSGLLRDEGLERFHWRPKVLQYVSSGNIGVGCLQWAEGEMILREARERGGIGGCAEQRGKCWLVDLKVTVSRSKRGWEGAAPCKGVSCFLGYYCAGVQYVQY